MNLAILKDIEQLRQVALLQEREIVVLHRRIAQLKAENARLQGHTEADLQAELEILKERMQAQRRTLFGQSSERSHGSQEKSTSRERRRPRRGHGPRPQPELPTVEKVVELPEAERVCDLCGGRLEVWEGQGEASEEIDVIQREYRVVKRVREKYHCRCCGGSVKSAPAPPKVIPGGRYSVDFAVQVVIDKYADHLPLARQQKIMRRRGLIIERQTLWDQVEAVSRHLTPTYLALGGRVLSAPVVGADETRWPVMAGHRGKGSKQWWVWAATSEDAVFYRIAESRDTAAAAELLGGYQGILVVDGYSVYGSLKREAAAARAGPGELPGTGAGPPGAGPLPDYEIAGCWAHVRRKFLGAAPSYPAAARAVQLINRLYFVERYARHKRPDDPAYLLELRGRVSRRIVDKLRAWLAAHSPRVLPRSLTGGAIAYADNLWTELSRFLEDPRIPLDNNHSERGLRSVVVGRKNHYGSRSRRGTEAAAICYTVIESARLAGLDPAWYLAEALRRAIERPGTAILPHDLLDHPQARKLPG
jgi:transposase